MIARVRPLPLLATLGLLALAPAAAPATPGPRAAMAQGARTARPRPLAPDVVPAPAVAREVALAVPPGVPQSVLDAKLAGEVRVAARVLACGAVDSAFATAGDPRLRAAAVAAVRWYVFAPGPPGWTSVRVTIDGREVADPLQPDVIAIARTAEAARDWTGAIEAWTGALKRIGQHPALRNEWAIREHVLALVRRLPAPPAVPTESRVSAEVARRRQEHVVAAADHADVVEALAGVLRAAPWWSEAYQWQAVSLLGCARSAEAVRALELCRLSAPDSAGRAIVDRALGGIAAHDTLMAGDRLQHDGRMLSEGD